MKKETLRLLVGLCTAGAVATALYIVTILDPPQNHHDLHGVPAQALATAARSIPREPEADSRFSEIYRAQLPTRFYVVESIDTQNAYVNDSKRGFCFHVHGTALPPLYLISFTGPVDCKQFFEP
ncbi:MAG: hypothetical protein Q8P82_02080 [bacterium]|nr:hypothetical protein [bacterium]